MLVPHLSYPVQTILLLAHLVVRVHLVQRFPGLLDELQKVEVISIDSITG